MVKSVHEEARRVNLIHVFGTIDVPRHTEPELRQTHLLGRSVRGVIARLHACLAGVALDISEPRPAFITINDPRGNEAQYYASGVMLDGWYLVESSDVHAEPGSPKGFYLLPLSQAALDIHQARLPYLEFNVHDFTNKYMGSERARRRIYMFIFGQLMEAIKASDEEQKGTKPHS